MLSTGTLIGVGLGEYRLARDNGCILASYGLGSCVGVSLYDPETRLGGLAHIILPDSAMAGDHPVSTGKFVDTAIPALLEGMYALGARRDRIVVRVAGGASVLSFSINGLQFDIGPRNVAAARQVLAREGLRGPSLDVGGTHGRTMKLFLDDGKVIISTVGHGDREL